MGNNKKESIGFKIPMPSLIRKMDKIFKVLQKKTKTPFEGYIIIKTMVLFFEHEYGFELSQETLANINTLITEGKKHET